MAEYEVYSGQVSNGISLSDWDYMRVYDGGTANLTTVNSYGSMYVYNGGTANSTTVNSYGHMDVSPGGTATDIIAMNGARLCIAVASDTYIQGTYAGSSFEMKNAAVSGYTVNSGSLDVFSGGVANYTTVNNDGSLYVSEDGVANYTTVNSSGYMFVYSDGTANHTTVNNGGMLTVSGDAYDVTISAGGRLGVFSWNYDRHWDAIENGSAVIADNVFIIGHGMYVSSGGIADSTTLDGGEIYVLSGGRANETVVMYDKNWMIVSSGGVADRTIVYSEGCLRIDGGAAFNTLATGHEATIHVYAGGSSVDAVVKNDAEMNVSEGGTARSVAAKNNGQVCVRKGGAIESASVSDWGAIYVLGGGSADDVTVGNCGELHVGRGGTATLVRENGGCVEVMNGAVVTFAETSFSGFVVSSGMMTVHAGTVANATRIENGELAVYEGGIANSAAIVNGSANFYRGAKVTGALTVAGGAVVSAYEGSVIDFDVSTVAPESAVRVNDLSLVQGSPDYTITVSARQAAGTYKLAGGAAGFSKAITVNTDTGTELGTLVVGGELVSGNRTYSLVLGFDTLSLAVEGSVQRLSPGDLNGDGRADIVMTITQAGHGAEGATGAWLIQGDQTAAWGDLSQRNAGWSVFGTGICDSGKPTCDVYVKSTDNVVGAWVTDDDGTVAGWYTVGQFDASTQVLGLGDFNGDGQTDLLLRNTNDAVGCYFTDGRGWNYFQSLGDEWKITAVGDLDGDGRDDVVLKHDAGFAGSWLTQADGTMAWADLDTLAEGFSIVGAGDFNGDGIDDVLLKNGTYYGAWIVQEGSVESWMGLGDLGNVTVEQIADFDADGIDDLRIRTGAGDLGAQLVKGADSLQWKYYGSVGSEWSTSLAAI